MEQLPISVIIVAKNAEKSIEECLNSVQSNNPAEIIVVDGISRDRTIDIARRFTERIYSDEGKGFNHAQQIGAEYATQEYIAFIDADITMPQGTLFTLLAELKVSDCVSMQAKVLAANLSTYWERAEDWIIRRGQTKKGSAGLSAAVLKRDTVLKYKLDAFLKVSSDHDFKLRVERDGYKLGISSAFVYHHHPADFKSFAKQKFRFGWESVEFIKTYGPWHVEFWLPVVILYSLRLCLIKGELLPYFVVYGVAGTVGMVKGFFELMGESLRRTNT